MSATFGHRWTSAYGEDPRGVAGRVWASELAGMTREQIDAGLAECRAGSDPWPPSLPRFKAGCLQIPTLASVRSEAMSLMQSRYAVEAAEASPFAQLVWQNLDTYRFRSVDADKSDRMLREAYEIACEHVMRGGALPKIAGAIEQDKPKPPVVLSPEEKAERLERLREELLTGTPVTERPEPEAPVIDKVAVEADLQAHYSDRKSAAAGGGA